MTEEVNTAEATPNIGVACFLSFGRSSIEKNLIFFVTKARCARHIDERR